MAIKTGKTGSKKPAGKKVDLGAALSKASKLWGRAKERASEELTTGVVEFDDGRYIARLTSASLETSNAGNPQVKLVWKFTEGDYKGQEKWAFSQLKTEDNLMYLARDLSRLGYDVEELDDFADELPKVLKQLSKEKPVARISLKTKGEFQNVNIIRLLDEEDAEEEDEDESDESDESDDSEDESDEEDESDDDESEDEEEEEDETPKRGKGKKPAGKKPKGKKPADDEEEEDEDESDDDESDEEDESEEEDETDEEDDDEVTVRVGSKVVVATKAGKKKGTVTEILAKENAVRVTLTDGKKLKLSADKIVSVEEVPEKPKGKTGKKVTRK